MYQNRKDMKTVKRIFSLMMALIFVLSVMSSAVFADEVNPAADVMTKESFVSSDGITMPYRLYVPADYNAEKEYSFLLFLHSCYFSPFY